MAEAVETGEGSGFNQMSFTSISSSESGFDAGNTSQDTVDTAPLRIKRMPLLGPDYVDRRKASVENLLASKTPDHTAPAAGDVTTQSGGERMEDAAVSGRGLTGSNSCDSSFIKQAHPFLDARSDRKRRSQPSRLPKDTFYDKTYSKEDQQILKMFHVPTKQARHLSDSFGNRSPLYEEPETGFEEVNGATTLARDNYATRVVGDQDALACEQKKADGQEHDIMVVDSGLVRPQKEYEPTIKPTDQDRGDPGGGSHQQSNVCTPPKQTKISSNHESSSDVTQEYCCKSLCCATFCALFKRKNICTRFSVFDVFLTLGSIGVYVFDVSTDLLLSLTYYRKSYSRFYFGLTLGFVLIPSVIVQVFSFTLIAIDFHHKKKHLRKNNPNERICTGAECAKLLLQLALHIFQLAILYRYLRAVFYGWKSRKFEVNKQEERRKHFDELWKFEMFDINTLRLLESFLESAPQLILQIYIVLMTRQVLLVTIVSCIGSLVALSSMMVSIERAIRNSDKEKRQLSIPASAVMFCWRACTISSRVVAFALFLTIQPLAFLIFILLHWIASASWIAVKKTHFCGGKKCAEYLFDAVCGLIYVFCFLNVHTTGALRIRMRCRMLVFYAVAFGENSVLSILWYFFRPGGETRVPSWNEINSGSIWSTQSVDEAVAPSDGPDLVTESQSEIPLAYALGILVAVHGLFILGMLFMVTYYILLHPNRTAITCCCLVQPTTRGKEKDSFKLVSAPLNEFSDKGAAHLECMTPVESPGSLRRVKSPHLCGPGSGTGQQGSALDLAKRQFSDDGTSPEDVSQLQISSSGVRRRGRAKPVQGGYLFTAISHEDSQDPESAEDSPLAAVLFNRGKRAGKLYPKHYARKDVEESVSLIGAKEGTSYEARQTDRFQSTVTPTREKPCTPPSIQKSSTTPPAKHKKQTRPLSGTHPPFKPSILIRPGSQQTGCATRSATHQGPLSTVLKVPPNSSPASTGTTPSKKSSSPGGRPLSLPKPVRTRDYSASMSCLAGGRPMTYAQRRGMAISLGVPHAPSFTLTEDEVLEAIESSV